MAIQQRAERTRQEILSAAARVFDGLGYERASLARIAGEARVTTGALVFHFATKADLATAVRGRARAVTRTTVESACLSTEGVGGTAIDKLVLTTHALIRLFETDHAARAGERLARELDAAGPAPSGECPWRREVARLARYAAAEQALRPGVDATAVAALIGYVITGVELEMRSPSTTDDDETWPPTGTGAILGPAEERLRRIWELILPGLVHPAARRPRPTTASTVKAFSPAMFPAPTTFPPTATPKTSAPAAPSAQEPGATP
ncbi:MULTISPECIES: TetR/AcrR family transcriptional regulator [Streptomyces]|uniref:TetR/AcrR family transcriptional regulator n=1 Tax=Streptomyces TaxID=1883 RepID=UPI00099E5F0B|nr:MULTISPECIES: TetR/AcrR family transcriptional regulator [unclassified Streptomyces]